MATLEEMTRAWKAAVGSDSGLGDHVLKYDLKGDGVIVIDRDSVTNRDRPADVTFTGKIDVINGILAGKIDGGSAIMRGRVKVAPMELAMEIQPQIDALLGRLPKEGDDALTVSEGEVAEPSGLPPLPPRSPEMKLFEEDMFDFETSESYRPLSEATGLLIRDLPAAQRYSNGRALARVLRADRVALGARTTPTVVASGPKFCLVLEGSATFAIAGQGEVDMNRNDSWVVPTGAGQSLLDASDDFELLEYEFPNLDNPGVDPVVTDRMVSRYGEESYAAIPNFAGAVMREFPALRELTNGAAHASALRGNPPNVWDGSPWHMHHQEFQLAYHIRGTMDFAFESVGSVHTPPGTFWFQQPFARHREVAVSLDFEGVNIDLPAVSPTTVFLWDEDLGEYTPVVYDDVQKLSEEGSKQMDHYN